MKAGTLISGAAHGALIAAAIFGLPWLSPRDREPVTVTSVSFISEEDFEAARSGVAAPEPAGAPEPEPQAAEQTPPEAEPEPEPEQVPEAEPFTPDFTAEAPLAAPDQDLAAALPQEAQPGPLRAVEAPTPRPAARVAPEPVVEAESLPEADVFTPERAETPAPEIEVVEEEAGAPPEATPEPVTEPSPEAPLALARSSRPRSRPERLASLQPAPEPPAPEPQRTAAPEPEPEPEREPVNLQSTLAEMVARSNATPPTQPSVTQPTQPGGAQGVSGAPISASEKDGLRLAVQRCWNLPAGLREAQELKVTLAAELTATGDVIDGSIRLVAPNPAPDARYQSAYDAGRRALIRCAPYDSLPPAKFDQWRSIEVVFNPEGMVSW